MNNMNWKTWTKITAIILFTIAIANFYYDHYYQQDSVLSIQNFPTELNSIDKNKEINFTFFIYNDGNKPAFVNSVILLRYEGETQILDRTTITPYWDFAIPSKKSQEIQVTLPASNEQKEYSLQAEVFYDDKKISTEIIPVKFGGLI